MRKPLLFASSAYHMNTNLRPVSNSANWTCELISMALSKYTVVAA